MARVVASQYQSTPSWMVSPWTSVGASTRTTS